MNRNEMILALTAIREGKLKYSDLQPERAKIFLELENEGEWEFNGKRFTRGEIDLFIQKGIDRNKRLSALGLPVNNSGMLFLSLDRGCEQIV